MTEVTLHSGQKLLYPDKTHRVDSRKNGVSRSADGNLDVRLSGPGSGRHGTNPEPLPAAGWPACFEGAAARVARDRHVAHPAGPAIVYEAHRTSPYSRARSIDVSFPLL